MGNLVHSEVWGKVKWGSEKMRQTCSLLALLVIYMETEVFAYLDPGVSSFALQVIAASIVAVLFAVRKSLKTIVSFFTRDRTKRDGRGKENE